MRATLQTAMDSRIPNTLGICADSDEFKSIINEGQERLIVRGHWKGSYQPINLCVTNGCLTFPRQVASISEISLCSFPVSRVNEWFQFLPDQRTASGTDCGWGCPSRHFHDRGFFPTFDDIIGTNKIVRVYHQHSSDVGKRILIQGYDSNNEWIRSLDGSVWVDGFYLTFADPFVESTFDVSIITGVQKDATNADVLLYEVDTVSGDQRLLGRYQPSEKVPWYKRYYLSNFSGNECGCSSSTTKSITGLAKLEFIPLGHATDYLYIDNIPALKEICQSIRYSEMDTPQAKQLALLHERNAIKELNHQKINYSPNDSIGVSMNPQGSAGLWRKKIGSLK